jgi:glycosyltransferase involved in cell wall biosynthesis
LSSILSLATAQELQPYFDACWYLQTYQDVASAVMDAWQHYLHHGYAERRLPCAIAAFELEQKLWFDADLSAVAKLQHEASGDGLQAEFACWALARWHGSYGRWKDAGFFSVKCGHSGLTAAVLGHTGPWLLHALVLWHCGLRDEFQWYLNRLPESLVGHDQDLLAAMGLSASEAVTRLNLIWSAHGLASVNANFSQAFLFDALAGRPAGIFNRLLRPLLRHSHGLVTVIVPVYNAAATVITALRSLAAQSYTRLEVLVVDDASTDNTAMVVKEFCAQDRRFRLLRQAINQGAYSCRNMGMQQAKGDYITCHDADDWSHPDKLRLQLDELQNSNVVASLTYWVRCTNQLEFARWRMEDSLIYPNISSLLFHRVVFQRLGFWDTVRVNADTEYVRRLIKVFGADALVHVKAGVPLAFGRISTDSLTQQSSTHLRTQFFGVRRWYQEAADRWHNSSSVEALHLPAQPTARPFPAPLCMLAFSAEEKKIRLLVQLRQTALFDEPWYLLRNPDVVAAGMEGAVHYLEHGDAEGRLPGPAFEPAAYRMWLGASSQGAESLLHCLETGAEQFFPQGTVLAGSQHYQAQWQTIVVCAHQSGIQLYGAERSLLDVLIMLADMQLNVIVTLPKAQNDAYVKQLRLLSHQVVVSPYQWWRSDRAAELAIVEHFKRLYQRFNVQLVYQNTLVLWEPALAARQLGIKVVTHVRELPEADPDLCAALAANPQQIRDFVWKHSDYCLANSKATAEYLKNSKVYIVPNAISDQLWQIPSTTFRQPLKIALISSNIRKKGIDDFFVLDGLLKKMLVRAECWLYGPETDELQSLREQWSEAQVHDGGYQEDVVQALENADIVLNLSHFEESFGRTLLEGMAAGRVVIAYEGGAVDALIRHNETGFLCKKGDVEAVAQWILQLSTSPELCRRIAAAARSEAMSKYSVAAVQPTLVEALAGCGL